MKISYNWLKEYIDIDLSPEELAEVLTDTGLEVSNIEEVESIKGGLEGMVVGQVLTCEPHPDSDHLSKTTVDIGGGVLPVICGAPNVAAGQKVVVATVGATLYDGDKEFKIKKAKIRGEVSEGMICSEKEIGVGTDTSGIIVLPENAVRGTKAKDFYNIESDYAIEIDLTPNRIDGASHIGVARDVAAFLKQTKDIAYKRPSVEGFKPDNQQLTIPVEVLNPEACPRYSGVTISNIEIADSPGWLQNRLKVIGLTPINNVVDITNYVLFETGQPLHAFDADEIKGGKVVVRTMPKGTRFVTLDEVVRELDEKDLMICNAEEGMCIGGIFGGVRSGVKNTTKNIFLESACFDPVFIRRTAHRHGLNTDASFRFERGTDPNGVIYALKRAALLIKEIAGGSISSGIIDIYPNPVADFKVEVTYSNIARLIGKDLGAEKIKGILTSLEIKIESENERGLSLLVPPYRVDVKREVDIIEEVLRIYGYNNVEIPASVKSSLQTSVKPDPNKLKNTIADMLTSQGFNEIWSNSLTKASVYEGVKDYPGSRTVKLYNPLSSDLNGMRQTLFFGGMEAIAYNANRQNPHLRFYEFGNCYFSKGVKYEDNPAGNFREEEHLGLFVTGDKEVANWATPKQQASFFQLKTYSENILTRLGFNIEAFGTAESENELFSEGLTYSLPGKKIKLLELGIVATKWLKKFDIENPVFYADFDWGQVLSEQKNNKIAFAELPKYPAVRRDLALLVDKNIQFKSIKDIAGKVEKQLLREVSLFDVYEGKGIPDGKKSYAVSFILRDDNKTLKDKQIDKVMQKFILRFEKELGAQVRK
ncbi:Phenylalanyl-tRNA synthetase beta chain [hydrothermal vent metagenome]|uniref:Phenylalanine--tRNA ligase beta subunit n=1 Tax=hydrothermal vent metagenome TaxID=652676 RepID=A0A3B0T860_9ZZZZ